MVIEKKVLGNFKFEAKTRFSEISENVLQHSLKGLLPIFS